MSYKLARDDTRAVIVVKYHGATSLRDRVAAVNDSIALLRQSGYRRVLVDISAARLSFESPDDESAFAEFISNNEVLKQCKTAFLAGTDQHSNDFIEILASAKHHNLDHFTHIDAAYEWLSKN